MGIGTNSGEYELIVNGSKFSISDSWLGESLLYVLRERLGLYGSKNACEQGECGSCSVMMDDVLVCSCLVLAANAKDEKLEQLNQSLTETNSQMCKKHLLIREQYSVDFAPQDYWLLSTIS